MLLFQITITYSNAKTVTFRPSNIHTHSEITTPKYSPAIYGNIRARSETMSEKEIQNHIQTLVKNVLYSQQQNLQKDSVKPTITLSRDYGAQGDEIAKMLSEKLAVPIYDKQILEAIAKQAHVDMDLMADLDEKVRQHKTDWVVSLITGQNASLVNYRHHLVNVALGIVYSGGIIIGRGAHVILAEHDAFRLRLVGTVDRCAQRIANAKKISLEQAKKEVQTVNHERGEFLWETFKQRLNDPTLFDLIINTDEFLDNEFIVQMVMNAMSHLGYNV